MSFSSFWSGAIWRLVRPVQVVRSVLSSVRLATTKLQTLEHLARKDTTITTGRQYLVASVSLSNIITKTVQDKDGEHTVYLVTGLPEGAVTIGKSPDGRTALKFAQFYETVDGYVFRNDPTTYGVVSTRNGNHCTFCVCVGRACSVDNQDTAGEYCGALHDQTVKRLAEEQSALQTVNGLSGVTLALACGFIPATEAGFFAKCWTEGDMLFAYDGKHLLSAPHNDTKLIKQSLLKGESLTDLSADFAVIPRRGGRGTVWVDSVEAVGALPTDVLEQYPELRYAGTMEDVCGVLKAYGQYTFDTTNSPDDPGTQRLLRKYKSTAPRLHLTQLVTVETAVDLSDVSAVVAVCMPTSTSSVCREADESALSYILRAARAGAVAIMDNVVTTNSSLYTITDNSTYLTRKLSAGSYIHSIVLLRTGKNSKIGVILDEIRIKPTTVRSGESIAVKVTVSKGI